MTTPLKSRIQSITLMAGIAFLVGCGTGEKPESASTKPTDNPALDAIFVDAEPAGAVAVSNLRKTAKPGDTVVVSGKIAGAMNPFTDGFATAVLSDATLKTCDLIPGDECPTPWDACCADPEVIKASRLTIQILGDDSRPVSQSLKGVKGLKELDPIVVSGVVAEGSSAGNMIVNVKGLYQAKK